MGSEALSQNTFSDGSSKAQQRITKSEHSSRSLGECSAPTLPAAACREPAEGTGRRGQPGGRFSAEKGQGMGPGPGIGAGGAASSWECRRACCGSRPARAEPCRGTSRQPGGLRGKAPVGTPRHASRIPNLTSRIPHPASRTPHPPPRTPRSAPRSAAGLLRSAPRLPRPGSRWAGHPQGRGRPAGLEAGAPSRGRQRSPPRG